VRRPKARSLSPRRLKADARFQAKAPSAYAAPVRSSDGEYRRSVSQDQRVRSGYLLLADISGYTAFLAGTELEHANAIVRELTTLVRVRLSPPMRFVKLEGTPSSAMRTRHRSRMVSGLSS
jgi:hypothetical protein